MAIPAYPKNLRPESKRLWKSVCQTFVMDEEARAVLQTACVNLSRHLDAEDILTDEGTFFKTESGQMKKHPAAEISKNAHSAFLASLRHLNLEWSDPELKRGPGRPSFKL